MQNTLSTPIDPTQVDIRLAIGQPIGDIPINMTCPRHIHYARVSHEDDKGSLHVYRGNLHCFGCGWHVSRRYSSLAFLLGLWDGTGKEDSETVRTICKGLRGMLSTLLNGSGGVESGEVSIPDLDPYLPQTFHQYLMCCEQDKMQRELVVKRGYTLETIRKYTLGFSGTHWTIPIYSLTGELITIRYRADETLTDTHASDYRKYEGIKGRNTAILYPLPVVFGLSRVDELWVVEGEHDSIASNQAGSITLTAINGSSQVQKVPGMLREVLPDLSVGRWVIATDQDGAGERAGREVMDDLINRGERVVRANWPRGKDLSEWFAGGGMREGITYDV